MDNLDVPTILLLEDQFEMLAFYSQCLRSLSYASHALGSVYVTIQGFCCSLEPVGSNKCNWYLFFFVERISHLESGH